MTKQTREFRNSGIDFLRCVAMTMIVLTHLLKHGGVLDAIPTGMNTRFVVISFLEILVKCSVNVFAMLSGYVMASREFKAVRILRLWLQVIFYSALLYFLVWFIRPIEHNASLMFKSFLPTISSEYWYFTAYVGMFFFIPFYNILLVQKDAKKLIVTCFFVFSVFPTLVFRDVFHSNFGYSALWLSVCYLIGGYIKLYGRKNQKAIVWGAKYFGIALFLLLSKIVIQFIAGKIGMPASLGYYLIEYTSPFVVAMAVCLLKAFETMGECQRAAPVIMWLSQGSFAVYLIHEQYIVKQTFVLGKFAGLNNINPVIEAAVLILLSATFFVIAASVDHIRLFLFSIVEERFLKQNK